MFLDLWGNLVPQGIEHSQPWLKHKDMPTDFEKDSLEANKKELKKIEIELQKQKEDLRVQREQVNREGQLLNLRRQNVEVEMATAPIGSINEFSRSKNWSMWHGRLEEYFEANSIKDDKKAALFLTLIGREGYAILRNLCAPNLPKTKIYEELSDIMVKHGPCSERDVGAFQIQTMSAERGQDVKSYVKELKKASTGPRRYCVTVSLRDYRSTCYSSSIGGALNGRGRGNSCHRSRSYSDQSNPSSKSGRHRRHLVVQQLLFQSERLLHLQSACANFHRRRCDCCSCSL